MIAYSTILANSNLPYQGSVTLILSGIVKDIPRFERVKQDGAPRYIGMEGNAKRQDKLHDYITSLLEEHGALTTNEIASFACRSRGAAHSFMDRMQTAGLVNRVIIGKIYKWEVV